MARHIPWRSQIMFFIECFSLFSSKIRPFRSKFGSKSLNHHSFLPHVTKRHTPIKQAVVAVTTNISKNQTFYNITLLCHMKVSALIHTKIKNSFMVSAYSLIHIATRRTRQIMYETYISLSYFRVMWVQNEILMDILTIFLYGCKLYSLKRHRAKKVAFIEAISESKRIKTRFKPPCQP